MIDERIELKLKALGVLQVPPDPRAIRQGRGFSVAAVATKSGLSTAAISKIERGRGRRPQPQTLNLIANALGVPATEYRQAVAALIQRQGVAAAGQGMRGKKS